MGFIGQAASGLATARRDAEQLRIQREQLEERKRDRELARQEHTMQSAALEAALRDQGILREGQQETLSVSLPDVSTIGGPMRKRPATPVDTGIVDTARYAPLGGSGYVQDQTKTKAALAQVAQRKRSQEVNRRVATLRAMDPTLRGAPDDAVLAIAENDDAFQERLKYRKPEAPPAIDRFSSAGVTAQATIDENRAAAIEKHRAPAKNANGRPLPSSAVEKLVGIDNMLSMATDVATTLTEAVKNKTNVSGRVLGVLPTPTWAKNVAGMGGDKGVDARALIGNLYGMVAKERGGTALSASELRLLESYLPNENEDETKALIKAHRFIRTLKQMRENKVKAYGQYGYNAKAGVVDDEAPPSDQEQIADPEAWLSSRRQPR